MGIPPWSYSGLKQFKTCAKQYYEIRVAKNVQPPENTEATLYGKAYHTAAEEYIKSGEVIPEQFSFTKQHLDSLKSIPGTKYCEHKMGLTKDLTPCDFFDPQVWCRGVADLLIINEDTKTARVIDYKTGSAKYADTAQLELMALMVFKHFPKIKKVKGGLLFVVANEFKKEDYQEEKSHIYWRGWLTDVNRLETAHKTGVWNPTRSGLCKRFCPVLSCNHNGKNDGSKW